MSERYKRTDHDSPLYCPYCGKQFRMTEERYSSYWDSKRGGYALTKCKHCGKYFRYVNMSKAYADEYNERATLTMEEWRQLVYGERRKEMLYDTDLEMDCIRKRLIAEKEKEIQKLTAELEELKNPKNLKELVGRDILWVRYWDEDKPVSIAKNWSGHEAWKYIRQACLYLWKPNHKRDQMKVGTLTRDELTVSARMAEEMIDIWNKYVVEIYGDPKGDDKDV